MKEFAIIVDQQLYVIKSYDEEELVDYIQNLLISNNPTKGLEASGMANISHYIKDPDGSFIKIPILDGEKYLNLLGLSEEEEEEDYNEPMEFTFTLHPDAISLPEDDNALWKIDWNSTNDDCDYYDDDDSYPSHAYNDWQYSYSDDEETDEIVDDLDELMSRAIKIECVIHQHRAMFNQGWVPDFHDPGQDKYYICYHPERQVFVISKEDTADGLNSAPVFGFFRDPEHVRAICHHHQEDLEWYFNEYLPLMEG